MRKPAGTAELTKAGTLRDILLVIIGFNTLVFLAVAQSGTGVVILVGAVGVFTLSVGVYRIARKMLYPP
jgi:hypothetical protein